MWEEEDRDQDPRRGEAKDLEKKVKEMEVRNKDMEEKFNKMMEELAEAKKPVKSYPPRLLKKVEADEFIDLKELREDTLSRETNLETTLAAVGTTQLVARETEHISNKGEVTTITEYLLLSATLNDLYRHVGTKADRRYRCYTKHAKLMAQLLHSNQHTIRSCFAYDRAVRMTKAKQFNWDYDHEIAATNLVHFFPGNVTKKNDSGHTKKLNIKRKNGNGAKKEVCYNYMKGGCKRSQKECRFLHGCTPCGTGELDKHKLDSIRNKHLVQHQGGL